MMPFQASRTKLCAFKLLLYNAYSVLQVIRLSHYPAAPSLRIQESLPEGFETVLGKWFGGAELSAGEWQRVALARAFLRRAKLIILDEPTSMLDVWAEARWFSRFRDLAKGCTVLIISHRLTTTMQADVIHIIQNGHITESESYDELLKRHGRYSEAWESRKIA